MESTVKDWPGLGANRELGRRTIWPAMELSAHPYLARQLSTKDAQQTIDGYTHEGRFFIEVSEMVKALIWF